MDAHLFDGKEMELGKTWTIINGKEYGQNPMREGQLVAAPDTRG